MNLFLDCEFNGFGGELISMALIDEQGQYFYEVLHCAQPVAWVQQHVLPITQKVAISLQEFQNHLHHFLLQYDQIHIIADWPEDLALFSRSLLLGPGQCMITPPLSMQLWLDQRATSILSTQPHNALADAQALQQAYLSL
ncbi:MULTISPECIES: hypothetical protein [Acinetobacter]|uniref:Uncharacterized protein n=1 Tax=Acinetobacter piscicola TaxID=2006115 RepID=A0A4Q4H0V2_9GAMM|nr:MULTISPECIES: hypothetical protein [Acinetobacter]QOW45907.1 hypothetical protein G0028_08365 [Acinetobacter piscicola]RYL26658.1 hypothetical protein EWP19_08635 [Acinetobacter piscicola]